MSRQRQRRTLGSGPPPDLLFGELAYSDGNETLWIGRAAGEPTALNSPSAHTHDYAALVHGHPWTAITDKPATFPAETHTHDYAALVHGHPWTAITDKPSTFPTTWAEVASKPATFPPADHTHSRSTIALTPINGFSGFPSDPCQLTVYPDLKLATLTWGLARSSFPASETACLSWSAAYTPTHRHNWMGLGWQIGPDAIPLVRIYTDGTNLMFQLMAANGATRVDFIGGTITFPYS